jgi:raffinose/stachyose/melibiose transport system permease protein
MALVIVVPLATGVLNGLKTNAQVLAEPIGLPPDPQWDNYLDILSGPSFWNQMANSTIVTGATTLGTVALAAMCAFVFARIPFRGRELVYYFMLIGLLFPTTVAILPLYITLRQAGLLNNLLGVILPEVAFALPVSIVILRSFFAGVPLELEEAATIDGCSRSRFFVSILLPLVRPALAAVGVLTMVSSWNAYFLPLLVLNEPSTYTLPLGTAQFQAQFGTNWALTLAYVSLSMVPAVIFYLVAQRQMVAGLTSGALKG